MVNLALACFETRVDLVDDVNATFAANQTVCPVAAFQGLERILNLHRIIPSVIGLGGSNWTGPQKTARRKRHAQNLSLV